MNIDTKLNLFLLDAKRKNNICNSSVTNENMKLLNNKETKVATIITSLGSKYSSSVENNNNTSLADYDIKEKKQSMVIIKPIKKCIYTENYNDNSLFNSSMEIISELKVKKHVPVATIIETRM